MSPQTLDDFLAGFFGLFTQTYPNRGGGDFLAYLGRPTGERGGDEASVVDNVIVGPLLGLLGFAPTEQVYNQQKAGDRPDFAPRDPDWGTCFFVEDKNTSLELDLDPARPDSHLRQLGRYVHAAGRQLGLLTNGRRLTAWRFETSEGEPPTRLIDLDVAAAVTAWKAAGGADGLPDAHRRALQDLWDTFRKEAFAEPARLENLIAVDEETWRKNALPLGAGAGNEQALVASLQTLVKNLAADARRTLGERLAGFEWFERLSRFLDDDETVNALDKLADQRALVVQQLTTLKSVTGLSEEEVTSAGALLTALENDARAYPNPGALKEAVIALVDGALARKYAGRGTAAARRGLGASERGTLENRLDVFAETAFAYHQRLAGLRQRFQASRAVQDDYAVWRALVEETMLGDLDEEQKRDEFALQAAYVVFIRLLLIRVCEDKGVFPTRFITDGGFDHWREDIKRYLRFANGNPYEPLLDMAYKNAQNIYAHFFTGRELFNWYKLDQGRLIRTLYELSRFDFAGVDSDIVGEVYRSYLDRKEKKKRGQYYTPPEIVEYILDGVGYTGGQVIIGKRLLDPACGSGKFLVVAAKRLVDAYPKNADGHVADPAAVLEQVRGSLFGFDLNPFACYLAEVNLLIQVLPLIKAAYDQAAAEGAAAAARPPRLSRFHVYNVDALAKPSRTYFYAQTGTLMADERDEVEKIKERAPGTAYAGGFHFVVANPPYGAKLTPGYKAMLKEDYADVFRGQPDTYVFFYRLALGLLARNGRLGFITPNTFLMGTNTNVLRAALLGLGRVTEIVDLPQGIWDDANVDCALLFLAAETDEAARRAQAVAVNLLGLRDGLEKLAARQWQETLTHAQGKWLGDAPDHLMPIRTDDLLQAIEDACIVPVTPGSKTTRLQRLGDVTRSSAGVDVYKEGGDGSARQYIKTRAAVPPEDADWKPLLDRHSFVGRYEMRWGAQQHYLHYGDWLERAREPEFFDAPKLLVQDMRNRALKRRLVATYDDQKFYNRKNFNNIIANDSGYDLKYILALFNSSLLNYWFARRSDNLHINPSYFRNLPIAPADAGTQAGFARLVDQLLAAHAELNRLRDAGYAIRHKKDGTPEITIPYDTLLADLQRRDPGYHTLTLFNAEAAGRFTVAGPGRAVATLGGNVFVPPRHPATVVLRHNQLWLDVPGAALRRYLAAYLSRPRWQGQTYDAIRQQAVVPGDDDALAAFFAAEANARANVCALLDTAAHLDAEIDGRVLDLYQITDPADRARILGSAPVAAEDDADAAAPPGESAADL